MGEGSTALIACLREAIKDAKSSPNKPCTGGVIEPDGVVWGLVREIIRVAQS